MKYLLTLFAVYVYIAQTNGMLYIKDIQTCPGSKVKMEFKDKGMGPNGKQKVDLLVDVPLPIDDTYTAQVTLYKEAGGSWEKMYHIPKKLKSCRALEFFFGTIWHDLQKHSGIEPGTCPIQGKLEFKDYEVDSEQIKLGIMPKGMVNVTVDVTDKDNNLITCEHYILSNDK